MISILKTSLLVAAATVTTLPTFAQVTNPLQESKGYDVFTRDSIVFVQGHTDGAIATGGNLNLKGAVTTAMNNAGEYPFGAGNSQNYGMVINGRIFYNSGQVSYINQGYFRIGNTTGTTLYDKDNNNASTNLQITPGSVNSNPRVQMQRNQDKTTATQAHGINFTTAFNQFLFNTDLINSYPSNTACAGSFNFVTIPAGQNPHITLVTGKVNYLSLTQAQLSDLNNKGSIIFDQAPAANRMLIVNVTLDNGVYTWTPPNMGGIGDAEAAYVLYNFANATSLEIGTGNNSVYGTVYAPRAYVNKTGGNNNNGQIIAKSFRMAYGEVHYRPFKGTFPDCGGTTIINNYNNTRTGAPLPIKEIKLTATATDFSNSLSWKVLQEQDVASYSVEKSTDAKSFTTIQTIIAKGAALENTYTAEDNDAANVKETYYRVKVNFINGESTYSNTARISKMVDGGTSIYPNPFHSSLNVRAANAGVMEIKVSDISGRIVRLMSVTASVGEVVNVALPETLETGMYFVQVYGGNKTLITSKTMLKN